MELRRDAGGLVCRCKGLRSRDYNDNFITEAVLEQRVQNSDERRHGVMSSLAFYSRVLGSNIGSKIGLSSLPLRKYGNSISNTAMNAYFVAYTNPSFLNHELKIDLK
jgi:hypothetical protein